MSVRTSGGRARAPRGRSSRDPYGIGPVTNLIWPGLALVALVVIAILTLNLLNGQLPFTRSSSGGGTGGGGGPAVTAAPSGVVITPPETTFPGSIAYAKAGNIWVQTGKDVRQVTNAGTDSMPAFTADGQWIYFIRVTEGRGKFPSGGGGRRAWYDLSTPALMRVKADGSASERLLIGRYRLGGSTWFTWMREPTPSRDGKTVLLVTDGPNPLQSDVVLKSYDVGAKKLTSLNLPESSSLGHQDPAWRPDGKLLLYVKNGRDGSRGAPQLYRYDPRTKKTAAFTGPGYIAPSFSPDGAFVAATHTDSFGTDISILDGAGKEVLRVTSDHHAFSPVWSPAGNAVAFLHLSGTIVDLQMATLDASSGNWAVTKTINLTEVSGLDGASRPSWFVAGADLPAAPAGSGGGGAPSANGASPSAP
jgi:Tol biopolymer transport system component